VRGENPMHPCLSKGVGFGATPQGLFGIN